MSRPKPDHALLFIILFVNLLLILDLLQLIPNCALFMRRKEGV
jgi:hypothetical protein